MKKSSLLLLLLFIFASFISSAQSDFLKGYIITRSNDTLRGYIENQGYMSLARKCIFNSNPDASHQNKEYSPQDLFGYRFTEGKYYVSREVATGKKKEWLFLEYLIHGKVDIYYYRDESGDHYLIEKEGDTLVPLKNEDKTIYKDGLTYIQPSNQYIGILKYTFRDCPEVSKKSSNVNLSHRSLINIAKEYHNAVCKDEACIIYEKKIPKVSIYLGPDLGISVGFLSRNGNSFVDNYYFFRDSKWSAMADPLAGVCLKIRTPLWNEKISIEYNGFVSRFHSKTTTRTEDESYNLFYINEITYSQYSFNNSVAFKLDLSAGKFRPVLIAGGFLDCAFNTDYHQKLSYEASWGNPFPPKEYSDNPFHKTVYGLTAGIGVLKSFKGQEIYADLNYYSGLGIFTNMNTNMIALRIGYLFRLYPDDASRK